VLPSKTQRPICFGIGSEQFRQLPGTFRLGICHGYAELMMTISLSAGLFILILHGAWNSIIIYRKYQVRKKGILPIEETKVGLSFY
jgi:hypothetical protein